VLRIHQKSIVFTN